MKLTEEQRRQVKEARRAGARIAELGRAYNVTPQAIDSICRGIDPARDGNGYEYISGGELLKFLADWLPAHPNEGLPLPRWLVRQYGIGKWSSGKKK